MDACKVSRECIDTKTEQDGKTPEIRDITVLEASDVHILVVTDHNNWCVKAFHINNSKKWYSRLQLNYIPWGITKLGDDKAMVAVPDANQIVTIAVIPDLVYRSHLQFSKRYFILAVISPSKIAASSGESIDILNMQGEVMRSVSSHNNVKLFISPYFMCVNTTGHILVTDQFKETVTCLTSGGETEWIYASTGEGSLRCPRGITTTDRGGILVTDSYLKKVIQLSESGKYVGDMLTSQNGLGYPESISVDKHGTVYICDLGELLKFVFQEH